MKQVFQNLRTGATTLLDTPVPYCPPGHILVATQRSLISAGTERMLVEFGQASLIAKARSQPERVLEVLDKIHADGLLPTLEAVFDRLDQPLPLGYCNVGTVIEVGDNVKGFQIGDRVLSNGPHAEIVSVSANLCARIPDGVSDEQATFAVLGAIALQGVRLAEPTLGESVAVIGLGLIGLIAVQILLANGCRVIGFDFNHDRLQLARSFGADVEDLSAGADPVKAGLAFSSGRGIDAVVIAASSKSDAPVHQAAQMSRKRGRIVLIGDVGLSLSRADFYQKELTFQVSCSYGPGRYDSNYESKGEDYPIGFVRWTAKRNFESILDLMASRRLEVEGLITARVPILDAAHAYDRLTKDLDSLGIMLVYAGSPAHERLVHIKPPTTSRIDDVVVGIIGAGNFTNRTLMPALKKCGVRLKAIASRSGTSAALTGRKFGIENALSDYHALLNDNEINTVIITTRHDTHASLVIEALEAGKHVLVEKPLALNREELSRIGEAVTRADGRQLLVGFNRRFSLLLIGIQRLLEGRRQPISMIYTVNAGALPPDHWTRDRAVGGGRIIGEGCHFIDSLLFLAGSPIVGVEAQMMGRASGAEALDDTMTILLDFEDGSTGVVHYLANGNKRFPKERLEVFSDGRIAVLDNFRSLRGYGWPGLVSMRVPGQDKGHRSEVAAFIQRIKEGGDWLIPWHDLRDVALATFAAVERADQRSAGIDLPAGKTDIEDIRP